MFLLGAISFRYYQFINKRPVNIELRTIIILLYFIFLFFYDYIPGSGTILSNIKILTFYCFTGFSIPYIFQLTKKSKLDNRIGDLSYPIYIVHMLIIYITTLLISYFEWQIHRGWVVLIVTIIVSYLLVRFIADPVEKIRQARVKSKH